MPELLAGMLTRAVELTGTTIMPKPMPASPIVHPSVLSPAVGLITTSVSSTPAPASTTTERHRDARTDPSDPATGVEGRDDNAREHRQEVSSEGVRAHRSNDFEIEGDEEEDRKDGEVARKGDHGRAGEGAIAHPAHVQHRVSGDRFDDEVRDEARARDGVQRQHAARVVAPRLSRDGGVGGEADRHAREEEARSSRCVGESR